MEIKWLGHSFFLITNSRNIRIAMDPFEDVLGYKISRPRAEVVTVSHNHFDHDAPRMVKGLHPVLKGPVERDIHKIHFKGIRTYHDDQKGKLRGENTIFVIQTDELKIVHLGDLGHIPDDKVLSFMEGVNVLFIPVGGTYTIGPRRAKEIVMVLEPDITIPMHYWTPYIKLPLRPIDEFASLFDRVKYLKKDTINIEKDRLSKKGEILIFEL